MKKIERKNNLNTQKRVSRLDYLNLGVKQSTRSNSRHCSVQE